MLVKLIFGLLLISAAAIAQTNHQPIPKMPQSGVPTPAPQTTLNPSSVPGIPPVPNSVPGVVTPAPNALPVNPARRDTLLRPTPNLRENINTRGLRNKKNTRIDSLKGNSIMPPDSMIKR